MVFLCRLRQFSHRSNGRHVLILISAAGIAIYYIWSAELTQKYGLMPVAAWNMLVGLMTVLPLAGWEMSGQSITITTELLAVIIYLGVLVTVIGLILWLYLLKTIPARIAASVQYLQPVFGISASAFLFGDKLGLLFAVGVALVLAGLGVNGRTQQAGLLKSALSNSDSNSRISRTSAARPSSSPRDDQSVQGLSFCNWHRASC
ncbi:DMT family transporter [Brucella pituitosa]|uniref:DMT family transporter n=1 Tax=Brucella pituitosa TaxID=571256 RepID=A0ABS3K5Z7_9HYPH|nr:DMT family transporter [Brucella pituitosa]